MPRHGKKRHKNRQMMEHKIILLVRVNVFNSTHPTKRNFSIIICFMLFAEWLQITLFLSRIFEFFRTNGRRTKWKSIFIIEDGIDRNLRWIDTSFPYSIVEGSRRLRRYFFIILFIGLWMNSQILKFVIKNFYVMCESEKVKSFISSSLAALELVDKQQR